MQSELIRRANTYIAGGALGAFHLPENLRMVITHGEGSRVYDANGKEYIDYIMGAGAAIVGHAHPEVVEAVQAQAAKSSTFYVLTEPAIELAEKIVKAVPCGEALRFQLGGGDATFVALRIARAATGRKLILKFEGGFHGAHDLAQMSVDVRPDARPAAVRESLGIPEELVDHVVVAQFNDLAGVKEIIDARGHEIAAIILEPIQRSLVPRDGFLQGLRELATEHGIILIFDEIVTGFMVAWGGAQELYGVLPDLACYGKTIGGGYPLTAVVGRRDLLELADPARRGKTDYAYVGGTLTGNPIGAAAGLAALRVLERPGTYERWRKVANLLRTGIAEAGRRYKLPLHVLGEGPILQVVFSDRDVFHSAEHLSQIDHPRTLRFYYELISRGVLVLPKSKIYVSLAHTEDDVSQTLRTIDRILRETA